MIYCHFSTICAICGTVCAVCGIVCAVCAVCAICAVQYCRIFIPRPLPSSCLQHSKLLCCAIQKMKRRSFLGDESLPDKIRQLSRSVPLVLTLLFGLNSDLMNRSRNKRESAVPNYPFFGPLSRIR
jgi:hypothetical protein